MMFEERFELLTNNGPDQGRPYPVQNLLVGDVVARWEEGDSLFELSPAYYNGEKGLLCLECFCSSERGNIAAWKNETFLPLEEGVKLAVSHGLWDILTK